MKKLLEKLNPHLQIVLADMREIGYSQVYIAEPMTGRPSTELTFLVEAKEGDSLPSQVFVDILRGKIEKLVNVHSCMIINKSSMERRIKKGDPLDIKLYQKTFDSARLLTLEEEKPVIQKTTASAAQTKKRKSSSETPGKEETLRLDSSLTLFSPKKLAKKESLQLIIKQLCANPEVIKIIQENPHILQEVNKELTSSLTEHLTILPCGAQLSTEN